MTAPPFDPPYRPPPEHPAISAYRDALPEGEVLTYPLDPLDRLGSLVQASCRIPVLDRASDGARLGDALDRVRNSGGVRGIAVLEIHGDGEAGRAVELGHVCDHVVECRLSVQTTEGERESGARRRERLEAERLEHAGRADVPRIRDDERLALVKRS